VKKLNELFSCEYDILIESIEEDSRVVKKNYLFCCIDGLTFDGHQFVNQATQNGAVAILANRQLDVNVPVIVVDDTKRAMNMALSAFYDNPESKLKLISVTGTDGKTTVSSILYQLLNIFDNCGYIGTNGIECKKFKKSSNYTTSFPNELYESFDNFLKNDCHYVSMEASSERLGTNRLDGIDFDIAIFTNITRDHLNNHKTMDNYIMAKGKLFSLVKENGYSIINNDDEYSDKIKEVAKGKIITYGINNKSDVMATNIIIEENKLSFDILINDNKYEVISPLSGIFNVYNLMASIIACNNLGYEVENIIEAIKLLKPIKSRMELVNYNQPFKIMIDYAHTANALKNLLEYVNIIKHNKLIVVTGSAGGRDAGKRCDMGKVVTDLADYVIFTMDDPRNEDPNDIIDDMISNIKDKKNKYERVIDRSKAISKALAMAKENDIVVIAGKGNDSYMAIGNKYLPYNDFDEVRKFFIKEV
jgi:UDP-N-acetylmuramoyl-L-alanyl-D-glutamate--2,6-diaminopimelate ligase